MHMQYVIALCSIHTHTLPPCSHPTAITCFTPPHSLDLDHPYVEDEGGVGRDDDPHPAVPVPQVGGNGDTASLPQTGPLQPSVHPRYDATVTKGNDVGGVVVKAAQQRTQTLYEVCVCVRVCVCVCVCVYVCVLYVMEDFNMTGEMCAMSGSAN